MRTTGRHEGRILGKLQEMCLKVVVTQMQHVYCTLQNNVSSSLSQMHLPCEII